MRRIRTDAAHLMMITLFAEQFDAADDAVDRFLLAEQRANVIQLDHDQFKASGHYTNAVSLGVTVETNGPEHIDRILAALREAGFQPKRIY